MGGAFEAEYWNAMVLELDTLYRDLQWLVATVGNAPHQAASLNDILLQSTEN